MKLPKLTLEDERIVLWHPNGKQAEQILDLDDMDFWESTGDLPIWHASELNNPYLLWGSIFMGGFLLGLLTIYLTLQI